MDLANIIFDLDGTLVDWLAGLEYSVDLTVERRGYAPRTNDLRAWNASLTGNILRAISGERKRMVIWETMENFEATPDEGMPAPLLASGYGSLPQTAARSSYLPGALDELGSVLARVGGVA